MIKELADLVTGRNKAHKVNLTSPNYAIIVEIIKNVCCLSVIRDYFLFSKYNLNNICDSNTAENKEDSKTEGEGDTVLNTDTSEVAGVSEDPSEPQLKAEELTPEDAKAKGEPVHDSTKAKDTATGTKDQSGDN